MICPICASSEFAVDKQAEMLYDLKGKQIGLVYHCYRYCRYCETVVGEKWKENAQGERI